MQVDPACVDWNSAPQDVMTVIFSKCDCKSFSSIMSVSKYWSKIMKDALKVRIVLHIRCTVQASVSQWSLKMARHHKYIKQQIIA